MSIRDESYYNTLYRVWSVAAFGAGTKLLAETSAAGESAESMYISLKNGEGTPQAVKAAKDISLESAEKIIDFCDKKGINIVTKDEPLYPQRLRAIYTAPPVLFYKGDISGIDDRLSIAVVGARKPSEYSRRVTAGIVSTLSRHGFDIVSGFAEGIDICAHMTAVKNGARTYAVLGCGLDVFYPKPNEKYKGYVIENGALITEYLPSTSPYPANFPNRNRIIAALSMGIAVIEAGMKSGSLNTASHGIEQGKTIFAVPPADLFDRRYRGNVDIIRRGAVPLMGARDIYSEYCLNFPHTIVETDEIRTKLAALKNITAEAEKAEKAKAAEKEHKHAPEKTVQTAKAEHTLPPDISPAERAILSAMTKDTSPLRADEIAVMCGMDIGEVLTELTGMEISGLVKSESGAYSAY